MAYPDRVPLRAPAAFPQTWKGEIHYYTADEAGFIYAAPNDVASLLRQGFRLQSADAQTPATPVFPPAVGSVEGEPPATYPSPAPVADPLPAQPEAPTEAVSDEQSGAATPAGDASTAGPVWN